MRGSTSRVAVTASAIALSTAWAGSRGSSQKLTACASLDGALLGNHSGGRAGGCARTTHTDASTSVVTRAERGCRTSHLRGGATGGAGAASPVNEVIWANSGQASARRLVGRPLVTQPEHEQRAAARRIHDLGRQRGEGARWAGAVADGHGDVLGAVDFVADRVAVWQAA